MARLHAIIPPGLVAFAFVLSACVGPTMMGPSVSDEARTDEVLKQRSLVVVAAREARVRVNRVGLPILMANADLCAAKEKAARTALVRVHNRYDFGEDFVEAATRAGLDDRLVIAYAPASERADRPRIGDLVLKMGDGEVPSGKGARSAFLERLRAMLDANQTPRLTLQRGDAIVSAEPEIATACDFGLGVSMEAEVNALADGENIVVSNGMLNFAREDDELALVIGHELAHNLNGHVDAKKTNATVGAVFDLLFAVMGVNTQGAFSRIASQSFSQEFESEADYVGLYLVARSGGKFDAAPDFWRRLAVLSPGTIKRYHGASHPSSPQRSVALEQTVAEIRRKMDAGQPLAPEKAPQTEPDPSLDIDEAPGDRRIY